jgi:quercetin dioxygenase-like cupin family protein
MIRSRGIRVAVGAVLAVLLTIPLAYAQEDAPGAKRTVLEQKDLSVPGYEGVLVRTELAPGAVEPMHTHPGDMFVYVLEGTVTLNREGQETVKRKAGEVYFVPAGLVHGGSNDGTTTAKLLVTFLVQKGKPLITPAK